MKKSELRNIIREEIRRLNEVKFDPKHHKIAKKDILTFLKQEANKLGLDVLNTYKFITFILTSHELLGDVGKMRSEALRGGAQTIMMKGMDGKSLGNLELGDGTEDDLNEVGFSGATVQVVTNDLLKFLESEHKKLKNANPLDTYHFVQTLLNRNSVLDKMKKLGKK